MAISRFSHTAEACQNKFETVFETLLIPSHISLTMIEAFDFEIPYKSASVCKVTMVANRCNVKEILHYIGIQSLHFVYFLLKCSNTKIRREKLMRMIKRRACLE